MVAILTINKKNLNLFNIIKVLKFSYTTTTYNNTGSYWNEGSLKPLKGIKHETYRKLNARFLFNGKNKADINKNISRFIEECKECIFRDNDFNYDVELSSNTEPEFIGTTRATLDLDFNLLNLFEDEKSITQNVNFTVDIKSSKPCYAYLEINASTNVISCTVSVNENEIVIKNIKGNETVYIGGGKVIAGNKSKIEDVDLLEFPKLYFGNNSITKNREDVSITLKYSERW